MDAATTGHSWPDTRGEIRCQNLIERDIPMVGKSTPEQLRAASQQSVGALKQVGPDVQWVQSYVTDDKLYCIYLAPDEKPAIREHARISGFPATKISPIRTTIDPISAE
jgi:hypothetical protein